MNRLEALAALDGPEHKALHESAFHGAVVNAAVMLSAALGDHEGDCDIQYNASTDRIVIAVGKPAAVQVHQVPAVTETEAKPELHPPAPFGELTPEQLAAKEAWEQANPMSPEPGSGPL